MTDTITILHLSDVHFGSPDYRGEMGRITKALVTAAHEQAWVPDLCIFSGDLAHAGATEEFARGEEWLRSVVSAWPDTKLFVVPGNHDVVRKRATTPLRKVFETEATFASGRSSLVDNLLHLENFFAWHEAFAANMHGVVVSDWTDKFACSSTMDLAGRRLKIVGLNTALLSCDDDDEEKLVQDVTVLNVALQSHDADQCVIAVGHHPLEWLTRWNKDVVGELLRQATGAHVYLHGHRHNENTSTLSRGTGDGLTTLEGGAAYQGSPWPQFFSLYSLDFGAKQIKPSVYSFQPKSGKWTHAAERSEPFLAKLPPRLDAEPSTRGRSPSVFSKSEDPKEIRPPKSPESSEKVKIGSTAGMSEEERDELDILRLLKVAAQVSPAIYDEMTDSVQSAVNLYSSSDRVKDEERIREKIAERRESGHQYDANDVEDIYGVRYVSFFQRDVPVFLTKILETAFGSMKAMFAQGSEVTVTIHTSRVVGDPLSIKPLIEDALSRWGGPSTIETRQRVTGYSSVHVVLRTSTPRFPGDLLGFPIEFQLRSGLEEFWGDLDYLVRYASERGSVGRPKDVHLNVLKALFDAVIQYADLIGTEQAATSPQDARTASVVVDVQRPPLRTFSKAGEQLESLRELPPSVFAAIKQAFDLWDKAENSRPYGQVPNLYQLAADAFVPFLGGYKDQRVDPALSKSLSYIARMERAFLLYNTMHDERIAEARDIYVGILEEYPKDAVALLRLGQASMDLHSLDAAIDYLDRTIHAFEENPDAEGNQSGTIYDFARLTRAMVWYRIFEDEVVGQHRQKEAIQNAIRSTRQVLDGTKVDETERKALNNVVYYAWEERRLLSEPAEWSVSDADYGEWCRRLIEILTREDASPVYREVDTLVRIHAEREEWPEAVTAAKLVCLLLERAAHERSGVADGTDLQAIRFSTRWLAKVDKYMLNEDERDSLIFARDLLISHPVN